MDGHKDVENKNFEGMQKCRLSVPDHFADVRKTIPVPEEDTKR